MDSFLLPPELLSLSENTPFGHNLLPLFQLKPGFININHGSVGAPPRVVIQARRHYEDVMEECPDGWFYINYGIQSNRVSDELKSLVCVSNDPLDGPGVGDLVLVRNASFAMNSIFRAWPWNKGDKLLYLSEAYAMVKLCAENLRQTHGVEVIEIPIMCPIKDNTLIDLVKKALDVHRSSIKMAIFSHISASPAFILPIKALIEICHLRGVPCVVDGAHALGQVDVNLSDLDPDFYVANGHKWFMTAKGAGFLYVKKKWRNQLHPAIITYGYGLSDMRREFRYQGVGDYSAYFTFSTAAKFRSLLGEKRIREYCRNLCLEAGKLVAQIWGTEMIITDENQLGAMCNVRIPLVSSDQENFLSRIVQELFLQYNTYLLVNYAQGDTWYARISAQIYNEISDYKVVAEGFLHVRDQILAEQHFDKAHG